MRFRWSLRTFFIVITLLAIMFAWRHNQRNKLIRATKRVQECVGEVAYRWQSPAISLLKKNDIWPRQFTEPYKVTLPDGSTETRMRTLSWTVHVYIAANQVTTQNSSYQRGSLFAFAGRNDDVAVDAVTVSEKDVDEELLEALKDLDGLKFVVVKRSFNFYLVRQCPGRFPPSDLKKFSAPYENAVALIESQIPDVSVKAGY